jgi:NADPH:quinone reductase-like Zn-dependent oxidoreductase
VPDPTPGPRDVLIRVCATSVNPVDWKLRGGGQRNIVRYHLPWILGLDVSGVVEAVGARVTKFRVGDEVWSSPRHSRPGTYAEYVCIDEREVARKPANLSHDEAASMPLVGLTAYQCLVDAGKLRAGQRVLVHAGAGGVGSFAVQLARHLGARVVATASQRNADVCAPVDVVLDCIGEDVFADNLRALRRGGRMANISIDVPGHLERHGTTVSLFTMAFALAKLHAWPLVVKGVRSRHVIKRCDGEQLQTITGLVEVGAVKPVIDRVVPLAEIQDAHRHSESNRARGKIVVHVA